MPTFRSFDELGRELAKFQVEFEREDKARVTRRQAEAGQEIALTKFRGVLGGDLQFSGWAPEVELQVKPIGGGASILLPTRPGAGPTTVVLRGRNQGNATGFAGPAINRRTGMTARNKRGNLIRRRTARRQWNGRTDPLLDPDDLQRAMDARAGEIAEAEHRRALERHFDVN
jgi:hypothetical protein